MGRAVMAFKEHLAQRAVAVPKGQQEGAGPQGPAGAAGQPSLWQVTTRLSSDYTMSSSGGAYGVLGVTVPSTGLYLVTFNATFAFTSAYLASAWSSHNVYVASNAGGSATCAYAYSGYYWTSIGGGVLWTAQGSTLTIQLQTQGTIGGIVVKASAVSGAAGATNLCVTKVGSWPAPGAWDPNTSHLGGHPRGAGDPGSGGGGGQ